MLRGCSGSGDARNPHEMGGLAAVAPVAPFPGDGGDAPGLSERAIDQQAREIEHWAYARRDQGEVGPDAIEAEINRRLRGAGILPEFVGIEVQRVMRSLFEGREAARAEAQIHIAGDAGDGDDLSIPEFLRR